MYLFSGPTMDEFYLTEKATESLNFLLVKLVHYF